MARRRESTKNIMAIAAFLAALAILFQNCGEGFKVNSSNIDPLGSETPNNLPPTRETDYKPIFFPIEIYPITLQQFRSGNFSRPQTIELDIEKATDTNFYIFLRGHDLGYRVPIEEGGEVNADGKVSLQINSATPIVLTNSNSAISIDEKAMHFGGIGGGFHTIDIVIPVTSEMSLSFQEDNQIRFFFRGTRGESSGYRILEFDIRNSNSNESIIKNTLRKSDPAIWSPPLDNEEDITSGKTLFEQRDLLFENPLSENPIVASCADCHASDGRDLDFYSYSNNTIVSRSVFHGLSIQQGLQIASYIRSLNTSRMGRPWNPPFQPGSGIDGHEFPLEKWFAGAGLEAIVENEIDSASQIFQGLFGTRDINSITIEQIRSQIEGLSLPNETINLREIPLAVQFPDWNRWLPSRHPIDIWGRDYIESHQWNPDVHFSELLSFLSQPDLLQNNDIKNQIPNRFQRFHNRMTQFIGDAPDTSITRNWFSWPTTPSEPSFTSGISTVLDQAVDNGYSAPYAKKNIASWYAVKLWETQFNFRLPMETKQIYNSLFPYLRNGAQVDHGEFMSFSTGYVFATHPLAPHIIANNKENFNNINEKQSMIRGRYDSTIWYQVQQTISGQTKAQAYATQPVDWAYHPMHIHNLQEGSKMHMEELGLPYNPKYAEPLRYYQTLMKMYQVIRHERTPDFLGWNTRRTTPRWIIGGSKNLYLPDNNIMMSRNNLRNDTQESLDLIAPETKRKMTEAFLRRYLEISNYVADNFEFVTCSEQFMAGGDPTPRSEWLHCLPPSDYSPTLRADGEEIINGQQNYGFISYDNFFADELYNMTPIFSDLGVSRDTLEDYEAYINRFWSAPSLLP